MEDFFFSVLNSSKTAEVQNSLKMLFNPDIILIKKAFSMLLIYSVLPSLFFNIPKNSVDTSAGR
jgi:uncharacterized membrane protein (DUF106 family)